MDYEAEFDKLVEDAFQWESKQKAEYFASLSPRVRKIIYRDTRYNVDFLYTAFVLNDDKIMADYAIWLFELMDSVLKQRTSEETAEYVIQHLEAIRQSIPSAVGEEKQKRLWHLVTLAQDSIRRYDPDLDADMSGHSRYETEIREYMDLLFSKKTHQTLALIQDFIKRGIPISDIYVEILAESMRRIGELWHTSKITVDTEHYCTSVTQMAMVQMYPALFESERKHKTLLCACPGSELHEMGARMVADLFENDGWDSIYLGAAVPEDALLCSIRENQPDLLALSVTMPQHLIDCRSVIEAVRKEFPDLPIAVGGKAFESTDSIWKQWAVDIYTSDARALLKQANKICGVESR